MAGTLCIQPLTVAVNLRALAEYGQYTQGFYWG
jgi:hypothetical protein